MDHLRRGEAVPDLILLETLDESALFATLSARLKSGAIYTYIGSVVISINPYQNMTALFSDAEIRRYRGRQAYELPPHLYALGDEVYRALLRNKTAQTVIISGESGAG